MQLSSSGYLKAVRRFCLLHTQADVCIQLPEQTLANVSGSNEFSFLSCKRAVIYHKVHGNGRLGNLLERNGFGIFHGTDGISDMKIRNTGYCNNITYGCLCYLYTV